MKDRGRALAVMIAVLVAGCLLGVAGLRFWERGFRGRNVLPLTPGIQGQSERLAKRLQLTAAQEAQLKAILEDSRRQINDGRAELEVKLETIRSQTNEKIAVILNEEQKRAFQKLLGEAAAHRGHAVRGEGKKDRNQGH